MYKHQTLQNIEMIFFIKLNSFLHKRCVVDLDNIITCCDFNCKTNNPQDQSSNKLKKLFLQ